ncbi:MAG: CvpA family protein [Candidatus Promineifilaceae bacterium]|jgi:uncharacterized membrane protein required for colicin V production
MISLFVLFWLSIGLFATIGAVRGWSKEVIALAGLVLSLFAINTFGHLFIRVVGGVGFGGSEADFMAEMQRQFLVLAPIHLIIAFFSYQAVLLVQGRIKPRETILERLLGFVFGAINGYLIVGTLWSLLEYKITPDGWVRLPPSIPYAFESMVIRPIIETPGQELIMTHLPIPFLVPWLPVLVVLIFLFVIVVIL